MTREEALKLLRGGPDGVKGWNRRRKAGEAIPSLSRADLRGADLSQAGLSQADLRRAGLSGADLTGARCGFTAFADVDLSGVKGLDSVVHLAPSTLGTDTLIRSQGKIPEAFLRGCGLPD